MSCSPGIASWLDELQAQIISGMSTVSPSIYRCHARRGCRIATAPPHAMGLNGPRARRHGPRRELEVHHASDAVWPLVRIYHTISNCSTVNPHVLIKASARSLCTMYVPFPSLQVLLTNEGKFYHGNAISTLPVCLSVKVCNSPELRILINQLTPPAFYGVIHANTMSESRRAWEVPRIPNNAFVHFFFS